MPITALADGRGINGDVHPLSLFFGTHPTRSGCSTSSTPRASSSSTASTATRAWSWRATTSRTSGGLRPEGSAREAKGHAACPWRAPASAQAPCLVAPPRAQRASCVPLMNALIHADDDCLLPLPRCAAPHAACWAGTCGTHSSWTTARRRLASRCALLALWPLCTHARVLPCRAHALASLQAGWHSDKGAITWKHAAVMLKRWSCHGHAAVMPWSCCGHAMVA